MQSSITTGESTFQLQDVVYHETVRMNLYKIFSDCFQHPTGELTTSLEYLYELFNNIGADTGTITCMIEFMEKPEWLKSTLVDFSNLFIGPYTVKAPPYGSVYLESERRVMGDSTLDAVSHYEAAGLSMNDQFHEVPDHISAELEFMYFLIFKEIRAINEGQAEDAELLFNRQADFLMAHIGAWVFDFSERVEAHAETDFYKHLAKACKRFIAEEISDLCIESACIISGDRLNSENE